MCNSINFFIYNNNYAHGYNIAKDFRDISKLLSMGEVRLLNRFIISLREIVPKKTSGVHFMKEIYITPTEHIYF